ncbi:MFS transporter [Xenorhabdus bovienii]|uniref:Major facilitator family transporter (Modular protein) n=1 Tax=Xenorhabdus bovienii str. kraussei Becker Underwood TaxID=1398204 RepID=A0A077PJ23_XENBV|nr:MFS transporter [Xenorhabdus bovienii]CDH24415.1 Major facilitator family transporter (modular protein) [Xenorhabdus bovienii str. kraussei Becker Underwood]
MSNLNQVNTAFEYDVNPNRLPIWKLLAFTMAGFLTILTETIPAGLLPQISEGLNVSEIQAGQLVTFYALGSVLAAIPVVAVTRNLNRRLLFLFAIGGLLVFNSITAISTDYVLTLVARFIAGMAAGVIWGLFAGYARRLVPHHLQGRALAIAGVGQPIALCIGVPLGTMLGTLFDWRGVFWIMSVIALLLLIWIRLAIPDFAGQSSQQRLSIRRVILLPGVRSVLVTLFAWILAHNILYTYIAPYLTAFGLSSSIDVVLLVFGIACIIGIWLTGLFVDSGVRMLTLLSLILSVIASLLLILSSYNSLFMWSGLIVWGMSFGGAPILLQTALADTAEENADVAQSMLVTIFNLAVAGGGVIGGGLLNNYGMISFPIAMIALSLFALSLVWRAKKNGFRPGERR